VTPTAGGPAWAGLSPTIWLVVGGLLVVYLFLEWEDHRLASGRDVLVRPPMLRNAQLTGGLTLFFFQFLLQAGIFFAVPLYLSVAVGLSAVETGVRLLPLSVTLLAAAVGIPRFWPRASPRLVVRAGMALLLAGLLSLLGALEVSADESIVTVPLLLIGLGVGALASQLGAVTVSAVSDEESTEVGGLQNTATNLGASFGTALAGAVLIAGLTSSFLAGIEDNPAVPDEVAQSAQVQLAGGAPFVSDADLEQALADADVPSEQADAIVSTNESARIAALRESLSVLAAIAALALFLVGLIPRRPVAG
jgi:hypothetical protein